MEINVLEKEKDRLKIQFGTIDQGMLNAIRNALWQNPAVEAAGFDLVHPQVGKPIFFLQTKGKDAKEVWNKTVEGLMKDAADLEKSLKSLK